MRTINKIVLSALFMAFLLVNTATFAQVAIGTGAVTPDNSSMLDVQASDKGVLVPRMTTAQREAIDLPAVGLLVYDTTTKSFWYHNATVWTELAAGTGSFVDLVSNQNAIGGMKTFTDDVTVEGDLMPKGRLMIPMAEISFVNFASPFSVTPTLASTGTGSPDNMVPIAPTVQFLNDNFTMNAGASVTIAPTNGKLKYTSGDPLNPFVGRYFHIALSFSFSPAGSNITYVFGVTLNDVVQTSSKLFLRGNNAGDSQSSAMHVFLWLNDGDEIGYRMGSLVSASGISLRSFNFVALGM